MISVICAIACIILIVLDICGKLHLEQTRGQVLLNLFALLGAVTPTPVYTLSDWLFSLSDGYVTDGNFVELSDRTKLILTLYVPDWCIFLAAGICLLTWLYTLFRTCAGIKIIQPTETPMQAAKRQLILTWISLPFFLLTLVLIVVQLVYILHIMGSLVIGLLFMSLLFLPFLLIGAVMLGIMSFWILLGLLPFLAALIIPYITGIIYSNRYMIACGICFGWKKSLRIFLQVLLFLPWVRWIVICCCMGKMQKYRKMTGNP